MVELRDAFAVAAAFQIGSVSFIHHKAAWGGNVETRFNGCGAQLIHRRRHFLVRLFADEGTIEFCP